MRSRRYERYGYSSEAIHFGEDGAVATLDSTACGRLNLLFRTHGIATRFGIHKSKRKSDSQVRMQVGHVMTKKRPVVFHVGQQVSYFGVPMLFPAVDYLACICLTCV